MVKVKVCGITNMKDALLAARLGADALGFIFYEESPRYIAPLAAQEIIAGLPPFIVRVGVFVNMELDKLQATCSTATLNTVQLHGDEDPVYCEQMTLPVLKAFRMHEEFDFARIRPYRCSAILLDTYSKSAYGGTGKTLNWDLARKAKEYGRVVLSGGLDPKNIERAIQAVRPYAVDVNSGVESRPGQKDERKLTEFLNTIKKVNLTQNG